MSSSSFPARFLPSDDLFAVCSLGSGVNFAGGVAGMARRSASFSVVTGVRRAEELVGFSNAILSPLLCVSMYD
jgi:hypothetical protein